MLGVKNYPEVLISLFEANKYENIVDSNFLNAYIPYDFPVPRIEDLRQQKGSLGGEKRHPGYIKSSEINQIFNYIGFIKRIRSREYAQYLPMLFQELKRFIRVIEEVFMRHSFQFQKIFMLNSIAVCRIFLMPITHGPATGTAGWKKHGNIKSFFSNISICF